jgi:hypothetical protein
MTKFSPSEYPLEYEFINKNLKQFLSSEYCSLENGKYIATNIFSLALRTYWNKYKYDIPNNSILNRLDILEEILKYYFNNLEKNEFAIIKCVGTIYTNVLINVDVTKWPI